MGHIDNSKIANILYEIADLLELKGVNFKPRAYRRAARNIENHPKEIDEIYRKGELKEIEGVGSSIASKVEEIIETSDLNYLKELKKEFPEEIQKLMDIQGIGPKTVLKLYKKLEIKNLEDLEAAAKEGKIRDLEGFGKKSEVNILKSIKMFKESQGRFLLGHIAPIAHDIEKKLGDLEEVLDIELAGSIRRKKDTIGDIDILIISSDPSKVMDFFTDMSEVKRILSKGKTRSTVIVSENLQVDLRVVEKESFGSALQYFTGSKEHNIKLRQIALDKNMKLSEYGLLNKKDNEMVAGEKEKEIYEKLGLSYIIPELREDRGEIEAALNGKLPSLICLDDIRGDLHIHTNWSEGSNTVEEMARKAKDLGYEYIAICDHSKTLQIAQGLDDDELKDQIKEIESINAEIDGIEILSGVEANIDSNGNLDVSKEVLKDLEFVVASIHSGFKNSEEKMTERVINAMHNDYVNAIGHPTGRILNKRKSYELDLTKVFETAEELNILMELNSYPERLDLSDTNCKKAKDYNLQIVINTDSHNADQMRYMEFGVATARRGWLEKKNVFNTFNFKDLKKKLNV
ncbi:MAG: DNA polymerase/3'-5' exonuclease PolX [Candidatus Lokiarchaeota archaeon]|nr:DNA polymerase/3'-5' exonuclease PolX [Candidatus Lokiarchaeota archaeon]